MCIRDSGPRVPLKIVGGGPLSEKVAAGAREQSAIEYLGSRPACDVIALMKRAKVLVFPSSCYEGLPMTIIEAFASTLPVVTSNLGSMSSLIAHERTGLHFRPGDAGDLASKVEWVFSHPAELARMRREARYEFETRYTAEIHHRRLLEIYERAIRNR
jgi:glycosyltransferase involved in cell wall biosynthesis